MNKPHIFPMAIVALLMVLTMGFSSCNSKEEVGDDYMPAESVAITSFTLNPDLKVMRDLDKVYFSIDLVHGVVYNADSLPKGTYVGKLMPKIAYASSVTSAVITMTGGNHREGTVNYFNNPNDTIDFTGNVELELKSGNITKTYTLKVNVHKEEPDTLVWDGLATASGLPSRQENPQAQKTVGADGKTATLLREADGSYTLSTSSDLFAGNWDKRELKLDFTPEIRTFTSGNGKYYILSDTGALMESANGETWQPTGETWTNIIGEYSGSLAGIKENGGVYYSTSWPNGAIEETELPEGFPVKGYSTPYVTTTKWASRPNLLIYGGETAQGLLTGDTWGFDGTRWANLSDRPLPPLYGATVFPYYTYVNSTSMASTEFDTMIALGGRTADGEINDKIYISYNGGLAWTPGPEYLQLPEMMVPGYDMDAIIVAKPMEANLSDAWTKPTTQANKPMRLKYEIDGDAVKWDCPYIFLFGGNDINHRLHNTLLCGVLRRLTFAPLF